MRGQLSLAILMMGLLSLASASANAARASPRPSFYVGVVENIGVDPSPEVAKTAMALAADAGFNSLRIIVTWRYPWQHEMENDRVRVCNAASAAADNHMALFLDVITLAPSGNYGALPDRPSQITWFNQTINDYLWSLIGPNGCARQLPELNIEIGNEPNYDKFCRPADVCSVLYTRLVARAYAFIHQEAAKDGFEVPVQVVAGELAQSHDPESFIKSMGQTAKELGVDDKIFDLFSYHCYGTDGNLQATPPSSVRQALRQAFGWVPPLVCSEYGVQTGGDNPATRNASELQQADLATQALNMAACSSLRGMFWFHLFDDPPGHGWTSGFYYYDSDIARTAPVSKTSLTAFRQSALELRGDGSPNCG